MLLKLFLARECIGDPCDPTQTCTTDGTCRDPMRTPSDLTPYSVPSKPAPFRDASALLEDAGASDIGAAVDTQTLPASPDASPGIAPDLQPPPKDVALPDASPDLQLAPDSPPPSSPGDALSNETIADTVIVGLPDGASDAGRTGDTAVTLASLALSPNPASFGASTVGTHGTTVTLYLGNAGDSVSGKLTPALAGVNADDFGLIDNKCVGPLAPLTTCAIQVMFKPMSGGTKTATLTVTDATPGSIPTTADLTGTAIDTLALAITGPIDLGSVVLGQSGPASIYTITNTGGSATGVLAVSLGDVQFAIGNDLCTGISLAAGTACSIAVTLKPNSAGVKTARLTVSSGAGQATQQIQGTGILPAALTINPTTLDFGAITVATVSATKTFIVTNTGGAASGFLAVVRAGGGVSQFATTSTTCQAALAPTTTCQVVVTFTPTITGSASATITVTDGTASCTGAMAGVALPP